MSLPLPNFRLAGALLVATAACTGGGAQPTAVSKNSPFLPPAGPGAATAAASETIEFAGVSSVGKRTDLIFHIKSTKKNHWIGIGETKEGIAVLNYDTRREQAVIKLNGVEKVLPLRKGTGPVNGPGQVAVMPAGLAPAPLPAMIPPPATPTAVVPPVETRFPAKPPTPPIPETQLRQETEARMLVSDLLEIGMAQRKAYEEAQRRAAEGIPATPDTARQP